MVVGVGSVLGSPPLQPSSTDQFFHFFSIPWKNWQNIGEGALSGNYGSAIVTYLLNFKLFGLIFAFDSYFLCDYFATYV